MARLEGTVISKRQRAKAECDILSSRNSLKAAELASAVVGSVLWMFLVTKGCGFRDNTCT
jgi:hypothetical protein